MCFWTTVFPLVYWITIIFNPSNFSNLGDSNFFSTYDKIFCDTDKDKPLEDDIKSNFTLDLDLERQVDSLLDAKEKETKKVKAKVN